MLHSTKAAATNGIVVLADSPMQCCLVIAIVLLCTIIMLALAFSTIYLSAPCNTAFDLDYEHHCVSCQLLYVQIVLPKL